METTATPKLKTMALFAASVSVMLTALPAVMLTALPAVMLTALPASALDGTADCNPATPPSRVLGPGHHQDVESR